MTCNMHGECGKMGGHGKEMIIVCLPVWLLNMDFHCTQSLQETDSIGLNLALSKIRITAIKINCSSTKCLCKGVCYKITLIKFCINSSIICMPVPLSCPFAGFFNVACMKKFFVAVTYCASHISSHISGHMCVNIAQVHNLWPQTISCKILGSQVVCSASMCVKITFAVSIPDYS